jgi:hypothetical protein
MERQAVGKSKPWEMVKSPRENEMEENIVERE